MTCLSNGWGSPRTHVPGMWPYDARVSGDGLGTPRLRAISVALAAAAITGNDDVARFRANHLGGNLLQAENVDTWIKAQSELKQEPALWLCNIPKGLLVAMPDGSYIIPAHLMRDAKMNGEKVRMVRQDPDLEVAVDLDLPRADTRDLHYATPKFEDTSVAICEYGGVFDELRTLACRLVSFQQAGFGAPLWKEAQAATFILTGYAPLVPEQYFQQYFRLPSRPGRRQTAKGLELAAFATLRLAERVPPAQQFSEWNSRFPIWAYKDLPRFAYDGREAQRRLLDVVGAANRRENEPDSAIRRSDRYMQDTEEEE